MVSAMSDDDKKATANPAGESNAEVLRLDLSAHNKTMDFLRTTERRPIGLPRQNRHQRGNPRLVHRGD
ncbi:MAG: hypothetical protein CR217_18140 [Beijerinckiaceae bacterium]|nr:MAG: hypothetical protein CR217_18140 [Beijerinckiaceae bacterium]